MSVHGFEFGHRTFFEAIRLATMLNASNDADELTALDAFVMQKVLPRIHGARRRIEPVLRSIGSFAFSLDKEPEPATFLFSEVTRSAVQLPMTFDKTRRMFDLLRANQFVSFSE
ncbi:MAG: hypothetical protein GY822_21385 [Deltaproteobacteria bacterium]|nr:hypothetical protein [Deltaproteobacteria bacterium]